MIFRWNENERRYTNGRNQVIPPARVRQEVSTVIEKQAARIEKISQRFVDGKISADTWSDKMRELIKPPHTQAAMTAHGGNKALRSRPKELGWLGSQVKKEYGFLKRFVDGVKSGEVKRDGRLVARAKMYANKARATFENAQRRREITAGMVEERNVYGDVKHCAGCIAESDKGWQPIGSLTPIGNRDCLANDKCSWEFR